jgi:hypothetical protein
LDEFVHCRKCGKAVPIGEMIEIDEVSLGEQNIVGVVRRFQPTCPDCGPFFHDRPGHHSTINKKEMTRRFPERERRRLCNALPKEQRRLFKQTMKGMREPKEGEVDRWLALQNKLRND